MNDQRVFLCQVQEGTYQGEITRDKIYEQIAQEMKRIGWSNGHGKGYLLKNYEKSTRAELDDHELMEFLHYLMKTTAVTQKS